MKEKKEILKLGFILEDNNEPFSTINRILKNLEINEKVNLRINAPHFSNMSAEISESIKKFIKKQGYDALIDGQTLNLNPDNIKNAIFEFEEISKEKVSFFTLFLLNKGIEININIPSKFFEVIGSSLFINKLKNLSMENRN